MIPNMLIIMEIVTLFENSDLEADACDTKY